MPADATERSWRAMGSDARVVAVGGPADLLDRAVAWVEALEDRWSRFRPGSEISALNRLAGMPVAVSPETRRLCRVAGEGWEITAGRFDPTVGAAVIGWGYSESFDRVDGHERRVDRAAVGPSPGLRAIEIDDDHGTVRLPAGATFDAGGLGKGLAADLVTEELVAAGAAGALVSLGGDVRVRGTSPDGDAWSVGIADPFAPDDDLAVATLADGAVTTSSTRRRRWTTDDGGTAHHIIDPRTGRPARSAVASVTVIAADGATAEVLATACVVGGVVAGRRLVEELGAGALLVDDAGGRHVAGSFEAFLAEPFPLEPATS